MKFLREPLVHFLLLGAWLFFLSSLLNAPKGEGNKRIVVSLGRNEHLVNEFSRTWQQPPTSDDLARLMRA